MKRREFIAIVGSVLAWPIAARAQQTERDFRIGLILSTTPASEMVGPDPIYPPTRAFVHALRDLGYIEGRNLVLERRTAEGQFERLSDIVAELVRLRVDLIVTGGNPPARAAKAVATTVPIVAAGVGDPVGDGLVQSLARPGGNLTGLMIRVGSESEAKRLQLLKEMLPSVSRVAYLGSKENKDWEEPRGESVRTAAQVLGVTLALAEHTPRQYADAFNVISRARAEALFVGPGPVAYADRALIVDFATRARLPSSFAFRESVELGGLMSYGVSVVDLFRRAATYVDKILKGAKPADLPVEQPTTFELVINVKTAKALGLEVPPLLIAQADELIE